MEREMERETKIEKETKIREERERIIRENMNLEFNMRKPKPGV